MFPRHTQPSLCAPAKQNLLTRPKNRASTLYGRRPMRDPPRARPQAPRGGLPRFQERRVFMKITEEMVLAGCDALAHGRRYLTDRDLVVVIFKAMIATAPANTPAPAPSTPEDIRALRLRCVELAGGCDLLTAKAIEDFVTRRAD